MYDCIRCGITYVSVLDCQSKLERKKGVANQRTTSRMCESNVFLPDFACYEQNEATFHRPRSHHTPNYFRSSFHSFDTSLPLVTV
jgi:hypothetical protein